MSSRRRLDIHNHHERSHKQNLEHTVQLTALNNAHTQDGVGGGSKLGVIDLGNHILIIGFVLIVIFVTLNVD